MSEYQECVSNEELVSEFFSAFRECRDCEEITASGHVNIADTCLTSYQAVMAWRAVSRGGKEVMICNTSSYSSTTRKHEALMHDYMPASAIHFHETEYMTLARFMRGGACVWVNEVIDKTLAAFRAGNFKLKAEREKLLANARAGLSYIAEFWPPAPARETYTAALSEVIDTCTRQDASRIARRMQQEAAINA